MPYIKAPPRAKFTDRIGFVLEYLILAWFGVLLALYDQRTSALIFGVELMTLHGIGLVVFGLAAAFGVAVNHYQIEYATIWFNIAGVMGLASWSYLWFHTNIGIFTAFVISMPFIYIAITLIRRWNYLNTVANTERTLHTISKR